MYDVNGFVENMDSNNKKVAIHVLKRFDDRIKDCNFIQLENLIVEAKPKSRRDITTICYVLSQYAKWLKDEDLYQMIKSINRKAIWTKSKKNVSKKFISYEEMENVIHDIGVYEDLNGLSYQTLIRCIYEGIYNDTLSVIENLRASSIHGNKVTLFDSEKEYDIEVSNELIDNMIELSKIDFWEKRNRWGVYQREIVGRHKDSVFKFETTANFDEKFTYGFYARIRNITKEYFEYTVTPLNIFISGIMHRIKVRLEAEDITLEEAFAYNSKNSHIKNIIREELDKCHYGIDVKRFRENVSDYLDNF